MVAAAKPYAAVSILPTFNVGLRSLDTTLDPIDLSFDAWWAATGERTDIDTALPPDLNDYRCVMSLVTRPCQTQRPPS